MVLHAVGGSLPGPALRSAAHKGGGEGAPIAPHEQRRQRLFRWRDRRRPGGMARAGACTAQSFPMGRPPECPSMHSKACGCVCGGLHTRTRRVCCTPTPRADGASENPRPPPPLPSTSHPTTHRQHARRLGGRHQAVPGQVGGPDLRPPAARRLLAQQGEALETPRHDVADQALCQRDRVRRARQDDPARVDLLRDLDGCARVRLQGPDRLARPADDPPHPGAGDEQDGGGGAGREVRGIGVVAHGVKWNEE